MLAAVTRSINKMIAKVDQEYIEEEEPQYPPGDAGSMGKITSEPLKPPKYILASLSTEVSLGSRTSSSRAATSSLKDRSSIPSLHGSLRNEPTSSDRWPFVGLKPSLTNSSAIVDFQSTKLGRQLDRLTTSEQLTESSASTDEGTAVLSQEPQSNNLDNNTGSSSAMGGPTGDSETAASVTSIKGTGTSDVGSTTVTTVLDQSAPLQEPTKNSSIGIDVILDTDMPLPLNVPVYQEVTLPSCHSTVPDVAPAYSSSSTVSGNNTREVFADMKVCEFQIKQPAATEKQQQ